MKKSMNAWCLPANLPMAEGFSLLAKEGFDGFEINMEEEPNGLNLNLEIDEHGLSEILALTKKYIPVSAISTGLHWKYPITDNDKALSEKGIEIVRKMIDAAKFLGADTVLVVPGAVTKLVSYDTAYERALAAFKELGKYAEEKQIFIGVENVWNKFLLSPLEMRNFVDEINNAYVKVYFDAGNILQFGYSEQWVRILGNRIKKIHIKDFDVKIGNITGFKNLLHGDMDWPGLVEALKEINYNDYLTAEISPYQHNAKQIVPDTAAAMNYILSL